MKWCRLKSFIRMPSFDMCSIFSMFERFSFSWMILWFLSDELYASWICITFWIICASFINVCSVIVFTSLKYHVEYQILLLIDWLHQVESSRLSRVLDSSRLDLSQNSWLKYLSWVEMFNLSIWIKSEDLIQVLESSQNVDMKTQLNDQSNCQFSCLCRNRFYLHYSSV